MTGKKRKIKNFLQKSHRLPKLVIGQSYFSLFSVRRRLSFFAKKFFLMIKKSLFYKDASRQLSPIAQPPRLRWWKEKKTDEVGYCVSFKDSLARCPMYVGGKGASLALLASAQKEEV